MALISCARSRRWTLELPRPTFVILSGAPPAPSLAKFDRWKVVPTAPPPPHAPPYTRDPFVAVANPSAGLNFGSAAADHPPSTGLARGLFMAPQTTSVGGVAPAPAVKSHDPLSKRPNAATTKAGKVSGKKNKAADNSSRRSRKKLAMRVADPAHTKTPASSLVVSAVDAHKVFDEMPTKYDFLPFVS
ncbi:hypothetical protein D1007_11318 [Hordeum vulgare]|nr:hypothetical protein D1007_11318 [Hordeum vulgare]